MSRSPGRRTENNTSNNTSSTTRPGKMVSVPATVNAVEKTNNGVDVAEPIKRISVKRNITSPRSQSPARTGNPNVKMSNETQQHPSLSRTSSRKAEHSPYRRNPLAEIDTNSNRVQARGKDVQGEAPLLKDSSANILSQVLLNLFESSLYDVPVDLFINLMYVGSNAEAKCGDCYSRN